MWQFGLLCLFIAGSSADPAYSSSGASAGSYSSSTGNRGGTGLYSSNYVGTGNYGPSYPYLGGTYTYVGGGPAFGFVPFGFGPDPYQFQAFIQNQFNQLQHQFNKVASLYNEQFAHQQALLNNLQQQSNIQPGETVVYTNYPAEVVTTADRVGGTTSHKKPSTNSYAPSYSGASYGAAASGSVGPGGVYQSVSTYPGGTLSNRFGDAPTSVHYSSSGPGFSGISTFASSDSSGNRQAVTSVNNNGKVTTYHTRN
ncbi:uncharacterized protein LOC134831523 isoform X2 [Culicoides brevitarsis]